MSLVVEFQINQVVITFTLPININVGPICGIDTCGLLLYERV